jgi:hypothetical protein
LGDKIGLETSAGVRVEDLFLRRAGFFFATIFFGATFFLAITFFLGLAGFFADFFLRAGFFLAMREVYHPCKSGTTGPERDYGSESCVARTFARISTGTHFKLNSWQGTRLRCDAAGCASFKV